jgi:hypothetical protein
MALLLSIYDLNFLDDSIAVIEPNGFYFSIARLGE